MVGSKEEKKDPQEIIDKANEAARRIEDANKKTEELIEKQEKTKARELLDGKADAGEEKPEKTKEEMTEESAKKMLEGTGFGEQLFPEKKAE